MKKTRIYILLLALVQSFSLFGQIDSINQLDEVVLSDVRLYESVKQNRLQLLTDSVLEQNPASLTNVLKFNTPVYFKENGRGMVSSVSFRGTTASQTAVIWNGININSSFNGQTDFNTILTANYDNIALKSGGGSVLYGSGAIGGSVHLNNRLRFGEGFHNRLQLEYGSFDTFFGSYGTRFSNENSAVQLNISRYSSENDFDYPNSKKKNENGDFGNTGINLAAGHFLNEKNLLKFYSNYFNGERGFSGTLTAPSNSKYKDENSRNLLEWKAFLEQATSTLRVAYLDETYRYYENRSRDEYSYGRAKTGIAKYDFQYDLQPGMSLSGVADMQHTFGEGTNIGEETRTTGSVGFLFSHVPGKFSYEISARKEFSDLYDSPLLFSLNTGLVITEDYSVSANFSRNYRMPTFNDLFWYAGGNQDLRSETSLQGEIGQNIRFRNFDLKLNAYLVRIDNLLRWVPGANGLWKPENTESVRNYGFETFLHWNKNFGLHNIEFSGTYAYTHSEDLTLQKALIYVPPHKATAAVNYSIKRFSLYYQFLYTGEVYTSSDNNYSLDPYSISNAGVQYRFLKNDRGKIGLEVQNILDTDYLSMPSRPMPGISFNSRLTFKF